MRIIKGVLGEVEEVLKNYKWDRCGVDCKTLTYNHYLEFEPDEIEIISRVKQQLNNFKHRVEIIDNCIKSLDPLEIEFINEFYFNRKEYKDILPLIYKIVNGSGRSTAAIMSYGLRIRKTILNKLYESKILEVNKYVNKKYRDKK